MVRGANNGPVILMTGADGRIAFLDARLHTTLTIDGLAGDIAFSGADCAEEFEVADNPIGGSVMCVGDNGVLHRCSRAYDTRVAGVVSGAGEWRAALRLGCGRSNGQMTAPVALVGRVACFVEADSEPVRHGDLLTTSAIPGHARRASDAARSIGAILGKSLGALPEGRGLLPVLVALQ